MEQAESEAASDARVGVVEGVAGPLHVGVAHADRRDTVAPAQPIGQQFDGVLGDAIGSTRADRVFVNQHRLHDPTTVGAMDFPVAAFQLFQWAWGRDVDGG